MVTAALLLPTPPVPTQALLFPYVTCQSAVPKFPGLSHALVLSACWCFGKGGKQAQERDSLPETDTQEDLSHLLVL